MTKHSIHRASTARPIQIGLFVVLAVFLAGALSAFAFGYTTPRAAEAQVMVGSVTVTAGSTAASSLSSAVTSVVSTVSSVVSSVTTTVTNTTAGGNTVDSVNVQGSNQGTGSGSEQTATTPPSTATAVSTAVVTAQQQDGGTGTSPAVTDASGMTTVSGLTVVAATQEGTNATNVTTQPCCTLTTTAVTTLPVTTPSVILPPVIVPPTTYTTVPACTLTASASRVAPGAAVTLSWTTQNATSGSVDNGVGSATPIASGSRSVVVYGDTTYTLTALGDNGQTVTCSAPVTVTTIDSHVPACTLTASASSVAPGSSVQLTWTSQNLSSGSINPGVGLASPLSSGSTSVVVNANTTYTFTGVGTNGQTVTCSAPVTVTTIDSHVPACTLTASASSVAPGSSVQLTWTTQNATSGSINNGVGSAIPVASGSRSAVVTSNTTYTLTAFGTNGQTVTCSAPVTVTTPKPAPACTLSASASSVARGGSVDLTWTTTNAASAIIDKGVGAVSPLAGGTKSATVNENTTYTMTVVGTNGQTITCAAPVTVNTGGGGGSPACTLTADPTSVSNGGATTLTWGGTNIASVFIDQGVGSTTSPAGSQSVTVNGVGEHTYTGTFTTTSNTTLTCTAKVTVTSGGGGGGCTSGCGGGGGGGGGPRILFSSLKNPGEQDLAFVYLSQMPYTGLELGPWGTALYWIMLILWSLAAAYLLFFTALPFAYQRAGTFGAKVKEALNTTAPAGTHAVAHSMHAAPAAHGNAHGHTAPAAHGHTAHAAQGSHEGHDAHGHHVSVESPKPTLAKDGFRAFGTTGALSIDDIVKGLAREAAAHPEASAHDLPANFVHAAAPVAHAPEAHTHPEHVAASAPVIHAPAAAPAPVAVSHDVRDFLAALIAGDRDAVFGTIRAITRQGGDSEEFLTHAVCALDDAYRAQVDGSVCHPDIKAITAHCHPSFLERLVSSLTTAVDGSYSTGVTGVKLALTRALAVVNG